VSVFRFAVVASLVLIGVPLVLFVVMIAGPFAWVTAAVVLPLAVLAVLLWLGWYRRQPDDGPGQGPERM
jgi:membrane protein implicated in regulation of membrane protease activity